MKYLFIIITLLLFKSIELHSQSQIEKKIRKLSNSMAGDYLVTFPIEIFDDSGKLVGKKSIVEIQTKFVKKIIEKNKEKLIPYLINNLENPQSDFISNLILYQITKSEAGVFKFYKKDFVSEWRKYRKERDLLKWKEFQLASTGVGVSNK